MARKNLLTQNGELRPLGLHNWTLPALAAKPGGKPMLVCPEAGECARLCYALAGTYMCSNVRAAHQRNLEMILDDPQGWKAAILDELTMPRFRPKPERPHLPEMPRDHLSAEVRALMDGGNAVIRIHDS